MMRLKTYYKVGIRMNELITGRIYFGGAEETAKAANKGQVIVDVRLKGLEQMPAYTYKHCPISDEKDQIADSIKTGVSQILQEYAHGENIYVHCGSGNGRASVMATAILLELGKAENIDEAECIVKQINPTARLRPAMREALDQLYSNHDK